MQLKYDVKLLPSHERQLGIMLAYLKNLSCLQDYQLRAKLVMVGNLDVKLVNLVVIVVNLKGF